jgi:pimeloyl-ACP methyl ester carboxylesterase
MFRDLIPRLSDRFRVVAPDLPGFGFTEPAGGFEYTFDALAKSIQSFTDAVGLPSYVLYAFDYGAPVGFRVAMARPERVRGIVTQNGNAYEEGLSNGWRPFREYWSKPTSDNRDALRKLLTLETTRWQYTHGTPDGTIVAPESYLLDQALLDRWGHAEIQLDLFRDYQTNVALYPKFQEYFRTRRPRLLAVWGRNDPFFLPQGAEAFKRDLPNARVRLFDTGHFALETHAAAIADEIRSFFATP